MRKYYLFVIRNDVYKIYKNHGLSLYKILENLYTMKNTDINYGLSLYNSMCQTINVEIINHYLTHKFRNKIINIHPSLIPSFCGKGYYGEKVHQGVIDYGAKVTGATVHFVDEGADTGAIIMQDVEQDDDAKSLAKRVLEVEHRILKESIRLFCENKLSIQGRRVFINE